MIGLYFRALIKQPAKHKSAQRIALPNQITRCETLLPDKAAIQQYHDCVGWQGDSVHPCYWQTRSMHLQLALLLHRTFPFAPMGLVHIRNHIDLVHSQRVDIPIELTAKFGEIREHAKGWEFDVEVRGVQRGQLVYRAVSTYLARGTRSLVSEAPKTPSVEADIYLENTLEPQVVVRSQGRRYAKVSGDYNPIHLFDLTAKVLGFKQAIAHGMWTLASSISQLCASDIVALSQIHGIDCVFKKPVFLPAKTQVTYQSIKGDGENEVRDTLSFALVPECDEPSAQHCHLFGSIY